MGELLLWKDNHGVLGKLTINFIRFLIFPYLFFFIFRILYIPLDVHYYVDDFDLQTVSINIKPQKTMFAVPWLIENKKNNPLFWIGTLFSDGLMFFVYGLLVSLPFLNLSRFMNELLPPSKTGIFIY